jgi:tape measure domain-containing protein
MEIAGLLVTADADVSPAERKLQQLENRFNQTGKQAQHLGEKFDQAGKASNQAATKLDGAGKAANQAGDKFDGAGKAALQSGDKIARTGKQVDGAKKEFTQAGHEAQTFTGKLKSVDSASDGAGSRINALIGKITGFNRASREIGSGGAFSFLPGLANISEIIQGIPQIGQLAGALVRPLTNAAEAGVRFNAFMETSKIGFETLLGGADKAVEHLSILQAFADKTPFQFEDLVGASQRMQAFGFASRDVIPTLTAIGDALSAAGGISQNSLDGVLRQFGQMRSSARVTAEDMQTIVDNNVPAWDLLATAIGKTVAQTRKLAETGKLNGREAVSAIAAQMEARYGGQMARISGTLTGRVSNLQDIQARAQGKATEGLTRDISETIGAALNQGNLAGDLAAKINVAISPVSGLIKTAAVGLLGGGITSGLTEGIAAGKGAVLDAATDLGLGSIQALATSIGAHSPAVKFIELGEFAGQGFEIGLMNSTRRAFLNFDKLTKEQLENARKIIEVGREMGAPDKHIRAAISTGIVESNLKNLGDLGKRNDHQSHGVFQQQPFAEWGTLKQTMDVAHASRKFFEHAARMDKEGLSAGDLAARVQRPRKDLRGLYGDALGAADNVIARLVGTGSALPVRVVGGDMGQPSASDNAYFSSKMLTRARARNNDRTAPSNFTDRYDMETSGAGFNLNALGQVKDTSGDILGIWDKTNQTLRDTGQLVVDVQSPFEELKTSGSVLGTDFLKLKPLITDIGDGVSKITGEVSAADQAVGAWADRVIQKSNKTWKEMGDGFQSTFVSALGSTEGGVKGMFSRLGLGFADMVRQMILKAAAAKLSHLLFGDTTDETSAGGLFGKLTDKLSGGGKGKKSGQSNEAVGSVVNSTVSSIANSVLKNQSKDKNVGAIDNAGRAMKGAIEGAGEKSTDAVNSSGKAQAGTLSTVGQGIVGQIATIASTILAGNSKGGFLKGLFMAAAAGAISGAASAAGGKIGGSIGGSIGGGGGVSSQGFVNSSGVDPDTGFAGGGLLKGQGTGTSDSILGFDKRTKRATAWVSNGEYVIKAATVAKVGTRALDHINEHGALPHFFHDVNGLATLARLRGTAVPSFPTRASGGMIGNSFSDYIPSMSSSGMSGKSSGAPVVNHHYNFSIHAKDAQSFHQSERQIQRQLASAVQGRGHN